MESISKSLFVNSPQLFVPFLNKYENVQIFHSKLAKKLFLDSRYER